MSALRGYTRPPAVAKNKFFVSGRRLPAVLDAIGFVASISNLCQILLQLRVECGGEGRVERDQFRGVDDAHSGRDEVDGKQTPAHAVIEVVRQPRLADGEE